MWNQKGITQALEKSGYDEDDARNTQNETQFANQSATRLRAGNDDEMVVALDTTQNFGSAHVEFDDFLNYPPSRGEPSGNDRNAAGIAGNIPVASANATLNSVAGYYDANDFDGLERARQLQQKRAATGSMSKGNAKKSKD